MATASLVIKAESTDGPEGAMHTAPGTVSVATAKPLRQRMTISAFTAVLIPAGTTVVIVIPPAANTQTLTLKGVTGDTGIALNKTKPTTLLVDAAVTSIGLTPGGAITDLVVDSY